METLWIVVGYYLAALVFSLWLWAKEFNEVTVKDLLWILCFAWVQWFVHVFLIVLRYCEDRDFVIWRRKRTKPAIQTE